MENQLRKLKSSSRSDIFVVHMSEILVSRLFRVTDKLGSEQVKNFTSRLRKLMVDDDETKHSSLVIGVWGHDIACVLATAVEKIRVRESENLLDLLETIKQNRFKGGGDIEIVGNKFLSGTFEIVNMVGTGERRIGLWSNGNFYGRRDIMVSSTNELETIIWPGGSGRIPRHRFLEENGEKKKFLRVLVTSENRFPHLVAVRPDPETGLNTVSGFCIEVFKTCMAPLNYELEFIPYQGMNYDNLAYELSTQRDKYDAAVGDITVTSNRSLYVDFTLPYTEMGIGALELKKKKGLMGTTVWYDALVWVLYPCVCSQGEASKKVIKIPSHNLGVCGVDIDCNYVVDELPYLRVLLGMHPGVFNLIARNSVTNGFGFMFQKGSGLAPNVSREIAKLRSSGMLEDIEKRWFQKLDSFITDPNIESTENETASKRLTIQDLGGLFIIAGRARLITPSINALADYRLHKIKMNHIGGGGNNNNNAAIVNGNGGNNDHNAAIVNGFQPLEVGDRAQFGGGFEFGGGGVSTSLLPSVSTKDYLLSSVSLSIWLNPPNIEYLLTSGGLTLNPNLPDHPQPPVLLLVPSTLLINGLEDGYAWQQTRRFDHMGGDAIISAACSYRDVAGYPRMYRRVYRLVGRNDVLIVHYKHEVNFWNTLLAMGK
ncbi:hypothetical protein AALP_AA6G319900 [Arabis alpina]|uniref:Ionotropic glutamate receptor C-terminal domain-containing protein n=1 Tax=Arabis alpina TaxID=50452 RepID=A0A087GT17_ARAAL|nr:hypothetical protein AALP_AA6G319900 [Arabis alpina]